LLALCRTNGFVGCGTNLIQLPIKDIGFPGKAGCIVYFCPIQGKRNVGHCNVFEVDQAIDRREDSAQMGHDAVSGSPAELKLL
jgi:hypothetical protein